MSLLFTFSHCWLNANAGYEVRGLVMADDYAKEFEKTAFPTSPPPQPFPALVGAGA